MAEPIQESVAATNQAPPTNSYEAGNEADFERLYQASYGKILGTLTAMLGDRAAAEDCAQDAFERAYKKWATWQPIAPAEAWVHRIAINAAVSYQRRSNLRTIGTILRRLGRPAAGPDPADLALDRDLVAALRRLSPKLRAALVLRHYHGYTNREIAVAIGTSERTVNKRLRAAGEKMRTLLSPDRARFPLDAPGSFSSNTGRVRPKPKPDE